MVDLIDLSRVLLRADLLRAGRIITSKEEIETSFILKFFDIYKKQWFKMDPRKFQIEKEKFIQVEVFVMHSKHRHESEGIVIDKTPPNEKGWKSWNQCVT